MVCLISEKIKDLRIENKITQKELADLCNVKQSCVSKWERGATLPDAVMIVKLTEIFKVSADYLLGIKEY
ncbi:MAG: helix-turn-helix transcriptional regulator [Clostridia bacterium]|nr:helix-turn-helix transcriptional regulator [Clostridia bacterium]